VLQINASMNIMGLFVSLLVNRDFRIIQYWISQILLYLTNCCPSFRVHKFICLGRISVSAGIAQSSYDGQAFTFRPMLVLQCHSIAVDISWCTVKLAVGLLMLPSCTSGSLEQSCVTFHTNQLKLIFVTSSHNKI
jgi:hypothetical protein